MVMLKIFDKKSFIKNRHYLMQNSPQFIPLISERHDIIKIHLLLAIANEERARHEGPGGNVHVGAHSLLLLD